jgi:hypothetical protein
MQEAALAALAALTEHSSTACRELLALTPPPRPQQQQQHQPQSQPQPTTGTKTASQALPASISGSSSSSKQARGVTPQPTGLDQQQQQSGVVAQEQQQQQQQQCPVVAQLLQLSRQRDAQLRCLVARCISNLHPPEGDSNLTADAVEQVRSSHMTHLFAGQRKAMDEHHVLLCCAMQELLHAARVMLPHLSLCQPCAHLTPLMPSHALLCCAVLCGSNCMLRV